MKYRDRVIGLFEKVSPFFESMAQNTYLQAITQAMMSTLGPVLLGSMALLIMILPIPGFSDLLSNTGITPILGKVFQLTTNGIAIYLAFFMGACVVREFTKGDSGLIAGALSLMSFLVLTPLGVNDAGAQYIGFEWLGPQGVFTAMIVGIVTGRIYVAFQRKGWVIKMPDSVPPMVKRVFESLLPTFAIGIFVVTVAAVFANTSYGSMHQFVYTLIQIPLQSLGATLPALLMFSIVQQFLWFFGIHGTNVIIPIMTVVYAGLDPLNMQAVAEGKIPPNIIGLAFFNTITWGGLALGLVILMMFSKSKQYKELGKVAVAPALFGITEPVIFGTPLVLNFDFMFPFIFNNSIAIILSYVLIKFNIVARFTGTSTIFGLPLGLHAATQGRLSIVLLVLFIQLVLSPILWYPWFKIAEKKALVHEKGELSE